MRKMSTRTSTRTRSAIWLAQLCGLWIALALMVPSGQALAAEDWLDDMPSVPTVVEVVRRWTDLQIGHSPQLANDPDFFPMRLMATFVLMRWVIEFQIETQGELSPERMGRARRITNDYMQAEYAIGLGTARRRGRVVNECQKDGPNRADFRTFPSAEACHRYVTQKRISFIYPAYDWRNAIFPELFCDRAKAYLALMQENILTLPAPIRSPAVLGEMPDGGALLGARFCTPYGGDADSNGLCQDWESPREIAAARSGSACAAIVPDKVRLARGKGLVVTLAKNGVKLGAKASFRVSRSSGPSLDANAEPIWTGEANVAAGPTPDAPLQVVLGPGESFRLDPTTPDQDKGKPWLIVEVTSGGTSAPVSCGRPLPIAALSDAPTHQGIGLFGPYSNIGHAVFWAGYKALVLTGKPGESGFVVLRRDAATDSFVFYATTPVPATVAASAGSQPLFLPDDYRASILGAFKDSCEEREHFTMSGEVHTHPSVMVQVPSNDNFSMQDFNEAIRMSRATQSDFGEGVVFPHSATRGMFLIPKGTLQVLMFVADPVNDQPFSKDEMECAVQDFFPDVCAFLRTQFSKKYGDYTDPKRQKEIAKYPESIKK
jgi:hypothetical protein